MSAIKWNERSSVAANAARALPHMISRYFGKVRKALRTKASPADLHTLRLASKKVRYTLELFEPCYGAEFHTRMETFKDVQTALGYVNDAVTVRRMVGDLMPHSARRKALRAYMKTRTAEKAEEFRVQWMEKFDAPGEERRWMEVLKQPRHTPEPAPRAKKARAKSSGD